MLFFLVNILRMHQQYRTDWWTEAGKEEGKKRWKVKTESRVHPQQSCLCRQRFQSTSNFICLASGHWLNQLQTSSVFIRHQTSDILNTIIPWNIVLKNVQGFCKAINLIGCFHSQNRDYEQRLALSLRRALNSWSFFCALSICAKFIAFPVTHGCCKACRVVRRFLGSKTINFLTCITSKKYKDCQPYSSFKFT